MNSSDLKRNLKKARQLRRKAETMCSHLVYRDQQSKYEHENGLEPRPPSSFTEDKVPASFGNLTRLCMEALTLLPEDPSAIEESQRILDILHGYLTPWPNKERQKTRLNQIFEVIYHGAKPMVDSPSAKQLCFVALYMKDECELEISRQLLDKALALDAAVVQRICPKSV